ncbi:MAG: acetate--CoA ligase family protein, partial [Anaerolineales bacterium]|nr:acetate--CoA ligase family protein [Anaerolineales bacterium]
EAEICSVLEKYGMRMVGPNTIGLINMPTRMTTSFGPLPIDNFHQGPISIVAQSGSASIKLADLVSKQGFGFSRCAAAGNKLDLDEADYLNFLAEDPATQIACFYLEGFKRGGEFVAEAKRCEKPIIVYKSGVTSAGGRLARTHTGAMMNDDRVVDAALYGAGVIRVSRIRDLVLATNVLRLPRLKGKRLAVMSPGAGQGVMVSDHCEKLGFELPKLNAGVLAEIEKLGRTDVTVLGSNPLDVGQFYDRNALVQVVEKLAGAEEIDGVIAVLPFKEILTGDGSSDIDQDVAVAKKVKEICELYQKPIVVAALSDNADIPDIGKAADFAVLRDPEDAPDAMMLLWRYTKSLQARDRQQNFSKPGIERDDRLAAERFFEEKTKAEMRELGLESMTPLKAYGLPVLEPVLATDENDLRSIVEKLGVPVALKINSPDILHKSDSGGVRLNVAGVDAATTAYREIMDNVHRYNPQARIVGVDVQPMMDSGWEVIVGARRDPQFGPVVLFGLGGIYAEALDETSLRMAPVPHPEALDMIGDLRAGKLLSGLRGEKPSDVQALADIIVRVSDLLVDFPQIIELDLNPVRVLEAGCGCGIVDARIMLAD